MKRHYVIMLFSVIAFFAFAGFRPMLNEASDATCYDMPEAPSLYDSIAQLDAAWEDAYNNCKLDAMRNLISEDLEFYHDQGGLMTSKVALIDALQNNICGKVRRELKPGSIEVYAIPGYGAVEMGLHGFYNQQSSHATHFAKFVHIWKREQGGWRITRVISLH